MATLVADRRLYVSDDRSEIVEEGDVRAAYLLVAAGLQIGEGDVARYRLQMKDGKVWWPDVKAAPEPENKMVEAPANKAADPEDEGLPDWPLKVSPAEYLEKYGDDAKNSALARRLIGE